MEKFRIAMYGMAQVTAIVYGVLATGATVKFNRYWLDLGYRMPDSYYRAMGFRDHGYFLLVLVLAWTAVMSYFSSRAGQWKVNETAITASGIGLTIFFALLGTAYAVAGATEPPHSTLITPLP
jgi:hypothetical protein